MIIKFRKIKQKIEYVIGALLVQAKGLKKESDDILMYLKDKYKGQRCFVIGNGPSLRPEDLDLLKDEVTFASNGIYKIFDSTDWRPTFYTIFDEGVGKRQEVIENASKLSSIKFFRQEGYLTYRKISGNKCFIRSWHSRKYLDYPKFSENLTEGLYSIATVTYCMIQIARWMGFEEIYILGADNRYAYSRLRDGSIVKNEGVASYFSEMGEKLPDPLTAASTWEMDVAYEYAEKYSREHGFRIYNATRGGFLEKFERVNLDEILS